MMKKGYKEDGVLAVLFESEQDRKRRRMQAIVIETVDAHRLRKMRDLLAFEKLAIFRKMNGFDRDVDRVYDWRSLPPTPQELYASLRSDLQKLKDAISMPAENTVTRPWQKTINFVDGLKGKLPDEELAMIKRYADKLSREATQAQVTVTPVDTVQYCSPCPIDPEPSSSVYVKSENNEGKMDPERGELKSSSAGTRLETPGQQCPPNEGTWDRGRTTASGISTAGVGSNQGGSVSSPTERAKDTKTFADISSTAATPAKRRHKTSSEENKQFDPGGKGKKAPPWNAAVTLLSLSGESGEAPCLCFVLCLYFVYALFSKLLFFTGDHFSAS